ncbi:vera protein [Apiospora arundinis]
MNLYYFISGSLESINRLLKENQTFATTVPDLLSLQHPVQNQDQLINLELERKEVERRLVDVNIQNDSLLDRLGSAVLKLDNDHVNSEQGSEEPFYRYHRHPNHKRPSHSLWKPRLGIICPGWSENKSAGAEITKSHVQKHLTDTIDSSCPFISMSDDPARIQKIMRMDDSHTTDTASILIISPSELRTMGIHYKRSTDFVEDFHLKTIYDPKDSCSVKYATDSHWMVHRWIPENCIVGEMSVSQFETFCVKNGIYKLAPQVSTEVDFEDSSPGCQDTGRPDQQVADKLAAELASVMLGEDQLES